MKESTRRRDRLAGVLRRLTADQQAVHSQEEQQRSSAQGGSPCSELRGRCRVTLVGTLRCVTLRPRGGVPAVEAELFDGTGSVNLIWLGRREIAGIKAGRTLRVSGLAAVHDGRAVMYNPRYELLVDLPA